MGEECMNDDSYESILQAWQYLNEFIRTEDFVDVLKDKEVIDEYYSRFGDVKPSNLDEWNELQLDNPNGFNFNMGLYIAEGRDLSSVKPEKLG